MRTCNCRHCGKAWKLSPSSPRTHCRCGGFLSCKDDATHKLPKRASYASRFGSKLRSLLGCGCKNLPWSEWNDGSLAWVRLHRDWIANAVANAADDVTTVESAGRLVDIAIAELANASQTAIDKQTDEVALIVPHFNPLRFRRLRETYYEWLPTLGSASRFVRPVELTFDGVPAEIQSANVLHGSAHLHFMWQKEALINAALRDLPPSVRYVAWLDHDIAFENPHWLDHAIDRIDSGCAAVQLFDEVRFLDPDREVIGTRPAMLANIAAGKKPIGSPGGAWMASREYLDSIGGLIDDNIVGGGDQAFAAAVTGERLDHTKNYSPAHRRSTEAWIHHASFARRGLRFAHIPGAVFHLHHGSRQNRQYISRWKTLRRHAFDAATDIRREPSGIWSWADNKPDLAADVRDYFAGRREDAV